MRASRCTGSRPKSRILRRLALARGVGGERPPTAAVPDMIPAALRRALCFHAGSERWFAGACFRHCAQYGANNVDRAALAAGLRGVLLASAARFRTAAAIR